jgi:hypothetical protein
MGKWTGSGNRIGHDPKHLRPFHRDPEAYDPPAIIQQVKARIDKLARSPRACPQIFFHHPDKPDARRQERSEGRERDSAYLCSMIDHMDLVSMRVGVPRHESDGGFLRYSVEELAEGTGMEFETAKLVEELKAGGMSEVKAQAQAQEEKKKKMGRFHRAATRMDDKGFVNTKRRTGKPHGPDNLYSSRVVSIALLRAIGLEAKFMHERGLESQRRRNGGVTSEEASAARQPTRAERLVAERVRLERMASVDELVSGVLNKLPPKRRKPP